MREEDIKIMEFDFSFKHEKVILGVTLLLMLLCSCGTIAFIDQLISHFCK